MSIILTGTIDRLTEGEGKNGGSIGVRLGPKPKKDKKGFTIGDFPDTLHMDVPNLKVRQFKVGDKVEVELRKAGAAGKLAAIREKRDVRGTTSHNTSHTPAK